MSFIDRLLLSSEDLRHYSARYFHCQYVHHGDALDLHLRTGSSIARDRSLPLPDNRFPNKMSLLSITSEETLADASLHLSGHADRSTAQY